MRRWRLADTRPSSSAWAGSEQGWDRALEEFVTTGAQALWRRHSDRVNRRLLDRWTHGPAIDRTLKTDLFDEATSAGVLPDLRDRARLVVGIDVAPAVLAEAKDLYPGLRAARADVRRLAFSDSAFCRVVSLSTLDHFESLAEVRAALAELHRVLRPGGELLLTLDNLANPVVWLRSAIPLGLLHGLGIVPYFVGKTCGPRHLVSMVREVGFEVLECTAIMHAPRVFAVALVRRLEAGAGPERQDRLLRSLLWFERCQSWPTRFVTGYFIAIRAVKPPHGRA